MGASDSSSWRNLPLTIQRLYIDSRIPTEDYVFYQHLRHDRSFLSHHVTKTNLAAD